MAILKRKIPLSIQAKLINGIESLSRLRFQYKIRDYGEKEKENKFQNFGHFVQRSVMEPI